MKAMQHELKQRVQEFLKEDAKGLYINGEYVPSIGGENFSVVDPATENTLTQVSEAQEKDINVAVQAAREAFGNGEWTKIEAADRSRLIYKFADLLEEHREELAQLEAIDNGKPYAIALEDDVDGTVEHFRYYAGWTTKIHGKTVQVSPKYLN